MFTLVYRLKYTDEPTTVLFYGAFARERLVFAAQQLAKNTPDMRWLTAEEYVLTQHVLGARQAVILHVTPLDPYTVLHATVEG